MEWEGDNEDNSRSVPVYDIPKEKASFDCTSACQPAKPKLSEDSSSVRVEYKNEDSSRHPSKLSLQLSRHSLVKQKKLQTFSFYSELKWEENGKQRSSNDFMKLRREDIILEGWLQKLAGSNSKFKVNNWQSRYAILLKSGILFNFEMRKKKLYCKGQADLTKAERVQIPQTKSGSSLRLEIFTTVKRVFLGFSTEAEMMIWRDQILAITDDGEENDEKST